VAFQQPEKIGKYNVISELGRGSSAIVYLSEDSFNNRKVALKLAHFEEAEDPETRDRFQRLFLNEASLAGKLNHPNIVGVLDAVVEGDDHYIVMEYVAGGSLKKFCNTANLLPIRQAVLVAFKCARALDYAYQNGIIHRDIKPANILLDERDDIKISDFGTAHISHAAQTQIGGFLGSPAYMSPEQINEAPANVQSDIYSLGVMMYELLAGRLPYDAVNSVGMINKVLTEDPIPLTDFRPDVPQPVIDIVKKAMAKDVTIRYKTWFDMAKDLADTFPQMEKVNQEISSVEKYNQLRQLRFFRAFKDSELWEVLRMGAWENYSREQNLIIEGDLGYAFYVMIKGQVKVTKGGQLINVLKAGDCFGEMSTLNNAHPARTASVQSVSEVTVLKIQAHLLEQLTEGCQLRFNKEFLHTLVERLSWTSDLLVRLNR
jgi:eukaryotic-like serine/threonine-protein kinase